LDSEITPAIPRTKTRDKPMTTETAVQAPKHPLYALTTSELSGYRAELEHALEGISESAPAAADLRQLLCDVLDEQDDRRRIASAR
jgi:hypothetical protein